MRTIVAALVVWATLGTAVAHANGNPLRVQNSLPLQETIDFLKAARSEYARAKTPGAPPVAGDIWEQRMQRRIWAMVVAPGDQKKAAELNSISRIDPQTIISIYSRFYDPNANDARTVSRGLDAVRAAMANDARFIRDYDRGIEPAEGDASAFEVLAGDKNLSRIAFPANAVTVEDTLDFIDQVINRFKANIFPIPGLELDVKRGERAALFLMINELLGPGGTDLDEAVVDDLAQQQLPPEIWDLFGNEDEDNNEDFW